MVLRQTGSVSGPTYKTPVCSIACSWETPKCTAWISDAYLHIKFSEKSTCMIHSFSAMFLFSFLLYLYCCRMLNAWCLNFTSMSLKSSMRSSSVVLTFFFDCRLEGCFSVVLCLSFCVLGDPLHVCHLGEAFILPEQCELLLFAVPTVIVHVLLFFWFGHNRFLPSVFPVQGC